MCIGTLIIRIFMDTRTCMIHFGSVVVCYFSVCYNGFLVLYRQLIRYGNAELFVSTHYNNVIYVFKLPFDLCSPSKCVTEKTANYKYFEKC